MRSKTIQILLGFMAISWLPHCNSYDLDNKIRSALNGSASGATSGSGFLSVLSYTPADGITNLSPGQVITVNFSKALDISTLTTNLTDQKCNGNIQVSATQFINCVRIASVNLSSDKLTLTIQPVGLPLGQTIRIKIQAQIRAVTGDSLGSDYVTSGFQIVPPPCGAGNCYLTMQANPFTTASGTYAVPIPTGIHAGKFLIAQGGATATSIYDPNTASFTAGPTITLPGAGAHAFLLKIGPNAGKIVLITGNSGTVSQLYDPATNTVSANGSTCAAVTTGALSVEITSGIHQGKYYLETASTTTACLYDPNTATFATAANSFVAPGSGAFSIFIESGMHTGKSLIVASATTSATLLTHSADHLATSPANYPLFTNAGTQPGAFYIRSGPQLGQILILNSLSSTGTQWYDLATGVFSQTVPVASPIVSCSYGTGAFNLPILYGPNAGKQYLHCATNVTATSIYNPQTSSFSPGPATPFNVFSFSNAFLVENGMYPGTIFIMNTTNWTVYFP